MSPSWGATLEGSEPDSKGLQEHLPPPSPRRMIPRYGAGRQDSWQRGLRRRQRRHHRPIQCHFLMPRTRPKATENTREGDRPRSLKTTASASQPRKTEEVEGRRGGAAYVQLRLSTLGITVMLPLVRRQGRVLLICLMSVC